MFIAKFPDHEPVGRAAIGKIIHTEFDVILRVIIVKDGMLRKNRVDRLGGACIDIFAGKIEDIEILPVRISGIQEKIGFTGPVVGSCYHRASDIHLVCD